MRIRLPGAAPGRLFADVQRDDAKEVRFKIVSIEARNEPERQREEPGASNIAGITAAMCVCMSLSHRIVLLGRRRAEAAG